MCRAKTYQPLGKVYIHGQETDATDWRGQIQWIVKQQRLKYSKIQTNDNNLESDEAHIYQFGYGNYSAWVTVYAHHFPKTPSWGLDSFQGLPDRSLDIQSKEPLQRDFGPKKYKTSISKIYSHLEKREVKWSSLGPQDQEQFQANYNDNVTVEPGFIIGFYNETLNSSHSKFIEQNMPYRLSKLMKPALIIDIDVDLYSSAKQALQFVQGERRLNDNLYFSSFPT